MMELRRLGSEKPERERGPMLLDLLDGPLACPSLIPRLPSPEVEEEPGEDALTSCPRSVVLNLSPETLRVLRAAPPQAAVRHFEEVARQQPDRAEGWVGVAVCLLREGDLGAALRYVHQAIRRQPGFPTGDVVASLCPERPREILRMAEALEREEEYRHGYEALEALTRVGGIPRGEFPRYARIGARLRRAWQGAAEDAA